jgi:hypothetical protein
VIADRGVRSADWSMRTQELKQRACEFGTRVYAVEALPKHETAKILGRQLLRAGTSVGRLTDLLGEANELLAIAVASIKTARRSRRA